MDKYKFNIKLIANLSLLATLALLLSPLGAASHVEPPGYVLFEDKQLFSLHDRIGAFSPTDRAELVSRRLQQLADDDHFDPQMIVVSTHDNVSDVIASDLILMTITPDDAAAESSSPPVLADEFAHKMRAAIEQSRAEKTPKKLVIQFAYACLFTLALFGWLWGLAKFSRKITQLAHNKSLVPALRFRQMEIFSTDRITRITIGLVRGFKLIMTLLGFYLYVPSVLILFPWTASLAPHIYSYVWDPIRTLGSKALHYAPNLMFIFFIGVLTHYILKFLRLFFNEIETQRIKFDGFYPEWADPTFNLLRVLVLAFALIIIFPYLPGSGSPAFQGVTVFLGVIVSFGSTSAIANMVAGIVLTYMRPFKIGDMVKIADTTGEVLEKNILVTRIKTIKNVIVTVPNSAVLGSHLFNYSGDAGQGCILNTTVSIGYNVPWTQVHSLLESAAAQTKDILTTPKPFVLQKSLDDFFVSYELNAYTQKPQLMPELYSELHQNIQNVFNEAKVEIMSPHYRAIRDGSATTIAAR